MVNETERIENEHTLDPAFIDTAVDFIRVYADRCHHGKEEEILFRDLAKKSMNETDTRIMNELIEEHKLARKMTGRLVEAKQRYVKGETAAMSDAVGILRELAAFYPKHIEKEDRVFFKSVMKYFNATEKDAMLREEYEFDRLFVHDLYKKVVSRIETER
jgi:hemerythrin-like domain-containing protein